jgi:hypothetical protein
MVFLLLDVQPTVACLSEDVQPEVAEVMWRTHHRAMLVEFTLTAEGAEQTRLRLAESGHELRDWPDGRIRGPGSRRPGPAPGWERRSAPGPGSRLPRPGRRGPPAGRRAIRRVVGPSVGNLQRPLGDRQREHECLGEFLARRAAHLGQASGQQRLDDGVERTELLVRVGERRARRSPRCDSASTTRTPSVRRRGRQIRSPSGSALAGQHEQRKLAAGPRLGCAEVRGPRDRFGPLCDQLRPQFGAGGAI